MSQVARIDFSPDLIDTSKSPTIQIINKSNKHSLVIEIPLKALKHDDHDAGDKTKCRDAYLKPKELATAGNVKVALKKINDAEGSSILMIESTIDTKVPGTGPYLTSKKQSRVKKN